MQIKSTVIGYDVVAAEAAHCAAGKQECAAYIHIDSAIVRIIDTDRAAGHFKAAVRDIDNVVTVISGDRAAGAAVDEFQGTVDHKHIVNAQRITIDRVAVQVQDHRKVFRHFKFLVSFGGSIISLQCDCAALEDHRGQIGPGAAVFKFRGQRHVCIRHIKGIGTAVLRKLKFRSAGNRLDRFDGIAGLRRHGEGEGLSSVSPRLCIDRAVSVGEIGSDVVDALDERRKEGNVGCRHGKGRRAHTACVRGIGDEGHIWCKAPAGEHVALIGSSMYGNDGTLGSLQYVGRDQTVFNLRPVFSDAMDLIILHANGHVAVGHAERALQRACIVPIVRNVFSDCIAVFGVGIGHAADQLIIGIEDHGDVVVIFRRKGRVVSGLVVQKKANVRTGRAVKRDDVFRLLKMDVGVGGIIRHHKGEGCVIDLCDRNGIVHVAAKIFKAGFQIQRQGDRLALHRVVFVRGKGAAVICIIRIVIHIN